MQVQRVQNNTQPHFTNMSFIAEKGIPEEKITPYLVEACKKAKTILDGVPECDMVDVQLMIDKDLVPRIITGTADNYSTFFTPVEPNKLTPEFLHVKTMNHPHSDIGKWSKGLEDTVVYKLPSSTEAAAVYDKMQNAKTTKYEKAALFARVVYESLVRQIEEARNAAKQTKATVESFYGIFDK